MKTLLYFLALCSLFFACGPKEPTTYNAAPVTDTLSASREIGKFNMEGPISGSYVLDSIALGIDVHQSISLQFVPDDILIVTSTAANSVADTIIYNKVQVVPEFKVLVTGKTSDLQIIQVEDELMWVKFLPPDSSQFAMDYFVQFANQRNPKFLPFRKL
jgi:hypothetical protein